MKKTILLISIAFALSSISTAQIKLSHQVIGSTGNYTDAGGLKISSTVGEPITTTVKGGNYVLTQGFQQPDLIYVPELDLEFFTGFTPNNDGNNDVWIINGIEQYPQNNVYIYSRWGDEIWAGENYNNIDIVWDGKNKEGYDLASATYFYIIVIPESDFGKAEGWVQIVK